MAISGGIKFLYKSRCDIDVDACTVAVSSGSATRHNMRDRRRHHRWESVGSDDATTETITIAFGSSQAINRLVLIRNNFKAFTVKYWNGSAWTHFASVVTKEGSQTDITETDNVKETNYYEFTEVTTDQIQIVVTTTQTVDAEKKVYEVVATKEVGTFTGYPNLVRQIRRKAERKESVRGLAKYTIFDDHYRAQLQFEGYPEAADHTIMTSLWEGREEFLLYPCGGDEAQFRFEQVGNRLEDLYLVTFDGDFSPNYDRGVYSNPMSLTVDLVEVL